MISLETQFRGLAEGFTLVVKDLNERIKKLEQQIVDLTEATGHEREQLILSQVKPTVTDGQCYRYGMMEPLPNHMTDASNNIAGCRRYDLVGQTEKDKATSSAKDLFIEQAVTISKCGDEVTIGCESGEDADTILDWLIEQGNPDK